MVRKRIKIDIIKSKLQLHIRINKEVFAITKKSRTLRRVRPRDWFRSLLYVDGKVLAAVGILFAGLLLTISGIAYNNTMSVKIDPTAYTPLLNTIARGESQGNYNAHFGNAANTTIRFTDMSVAEVLRWQDEYVAQGHASSAVGKYQIINSTLRGLVQQLHIDPNTTFDEALQDKLAIALLERRGAHDYVEKKLSREEYAANLAKEWAALPKIIGTNPEQSYYAGDGLNSVQISIDEILGALATLQR